MIISFQPDQLKVLFSQEMNLVHSASTMIGEVLLWRDGKQDVSFLKMCIEQVLNVRKSNLSIKNMLHWCAWTWPHSFAKKTTFA